MGSLSSSGSHINQQDKVVRHTGDSIDISTLSNDTKIASKSILSQADRLKQLESTIAGISSRVLWLDADYAPSLSVNGDNRIVAWTDKIVNPAIQYEVDTPISALGYQPDVELLSPKLSYVDINGTRRGAVHFDKQGIQLVINEVLDSLITGEGKHWTIIFACKFDNIVKNGEFVDIINKWDDSDGYSSFYIYLDDNAAFAKVHVELYSENDVNNGITVVGSDEILPGFPYVISSVYNASGGANLNRISSYVNTRDNKGSQSFAFGTGLTSVTNNDDSLTIGSHAGNGLAGYRGFIGHFYEFLVFKQPLDNSIRLTIDEYLGIKWGASQYMTSIIAGR